MKVTVIVPCHSEEDTIEELLLRLRRLRTPYEREIIVVDDGSTDRTAELLAEQIDIIVKRHPMNMGKGVAVRTGLRNASGDVVVVQDADLEYAPEDIPQLIAPIMNGAADFAIGSRFRGTYPYGMKFSHLIGNRVLSIAATLLYGTKITDVMVGHKALRKTLLAKLNLAKSEFEFEAEIVAKALRLGGRLVEVPVRYRYRRKGRTKISWVHGFKSLLTLIEIAIERKQ